jgi:transposase
MKTEDIRLEEFRKLKKEIRGSDKHLLAGIDIAKEKHNVFFGSATGKTLLKRFVFDNNREGFEKLLAESAAIKQQHNLSQIVFGMEPTANYHKPLGEYLIVQDQEVVLVSGSAVRKNRELLDGRWDKHDTKDAANVADLISQGKFVYYENPGIEVRELRGLLSLKRKLKKQAQGLQLRIRNNVLAQYFPEMDQYYATCEKDNLAIVSSCLSPAMIGGMEYNEFFKTVVSRKNGLRQHKHLYRIWQLAKGSIGCAAEEGAACESAMLVDLLRQTRQAIEQVEQEILKLCYQFSEYEFVISIPGFGPDVSAKVLAYIGDQYRFETASQVLKMAGFDLCASRSGKPSEKAIPVISKKGKADLRYALYQAAHIASIRSAHFKQYFAQKIRGRERERGIKTKMKVKLAAKMLVIAWTLMKNKEPFNPEHVKID